MRRREILMDGAHAFRFFRSVSITPLLIFFAALLSACAAQTPQTAVVLTYASPYSPTHPFSRADQTWMKWVEAESRGALRIQPYWSGSILSSEHSMTELRHGVVDIGLITPIYARGGAHLNRVQAGFYAGLSTFRQQVALYRCMMANNPQFDRELHDLVALAVQGGNLPGIVTRDRAIRTLKDLQGLRLRAPSELLGVLKQFGADPVDMPMGEVYSALAKGVLDGVVAPADAIKSMHFGEVAGHFNTLPIPRGAYAARAMGAKRFASLAPEHRALLVRSIAVWEHALAEELAKANRAGEESARAHHMQIADMPETEQAIFFDVYNRLAEENAQRLQRFGIEAMQTYQLARQMVERIAVDDATACETPQTTPPNTADRSAPSQPSAAAIEQARVLPHA